MSGRVVIERLTVRVPAMDPVAAVRLGREAALLAAERLAERPPAQATGAAHVRVRADDPSAAGIADAVVRGVQ